MTQKQWIILICAFLLSSCCLCAFASLELQGISHLMDKDKPTFKADPDDTIVENLAAAHGYKTGQRIAELILPVAFIVTGLLGVGILVGGIAEIAKRL